MPDGTAERATCDRCYLLIERASGRQWTLAGEVRTQGITFRDYCTGRPDAEWASGHVPFVPLHEGASMEDVEHWLSV